MRRRARTGGTRTVLALLAALAPIAAGAQETSALSQGVRAIVDAGRLPGARWARITDVSSDVRAAYGSVDWAPLWLSDGRPTAQARAVLAYLSGVDSLGLRRLDYDAAALDSLRAALDAGRGPADAVRFEATMSVATARVLSALQWGRVAAGDVHASFRISRLDFDLPTALVAAARAVNPVAVFDGAQPRLRPYRLLKGQLARYRALDADPAMHVALPRVERATNGWRPAEAGGLRRRLVALGDLAESAATPVEADTALDAALVDAIRAFQRRHGLTADGVPGPSTLRELERPLRDRIEQIELALERWRWLPREFGGRVIMVNVPEFRLYAFDRLTTDSTSYFEMDVVVGDAFDHRTPIFNEALQYLVLAPYWEVPTSIALKEIRPKAMRDPRWLTRNAYVLVAEPGEREVAASPANVARIGRGVRVRQRPGVKNALGRVKFMLPNPHNIYLHDTPSQGTFGQSRRDVSHGCIRLADPLRLATWVLRDAPEWNAERLQEAMEQRTTPLTVPLPERIPVLVVYGTAVATPEGEPAGTIRFLADIYGHDRTLARRLAQGYPYAR